MKKTCFKDSCNKHVEFACYCSNQPVYSCDKHLGKHLKLRGDHSSQNSLCMVLDPQDFELLYPKLTETQKKIGNIIKSVQTETKILVETVLKESQKLIFSLKSFRFKILKLLKTMNVEKIVDKEDFDEVSKILEGTLIENNSYRDHLVNKITVFYDLSNYYKPQSLELESEFLCFFRNRSKNLTLISIDKPDLVIPLDISNCFDQWSTHCELPNNKYFFYGGNPYISDVSIIDINKKTGIQKKSGRAKGYMASCYYKNKVYVFGGYNGQYQRDAESYNLITDSWEDLSPLPIRCGNSACVRLNDNILYAAYTSNSLIVYSISYDVYFRYGNFGSNFKIICNHQDLVYLFVCGKVYRSNYPDFSKFQLINNATCVTSTSLYAYGVLKDKNFYFALHDNNIYKFDFNTETIVLLKKY